MSRRVPDPDAPITPAGLLRDAVGAHRLPIAVAALFAMLHQAAEAAVPVVVGVVIDRAVATGSVSALLVGLAALVGVYLVLSASWGVAVRADYRGLLAAAHRTRMALTDRILDPRGGVGARAPGALLSIATGDARRVGGITQAVVVGSGAVAALGVAAVSLLLISTLLGVVVLVGALVVPIVVRVLSGPLHRRSAAEQADAAQAVAVAEDVVTGLRVVKGIGAERAAAERYRQASETARAATVRAVRAQAGLEGVTVLLTGVVMAVVALVAGRLATTGTISVGDLVTAVGLTQFLAGPFTAVGFVAVLLARARGSADRVADLLGVATVAPGGAASLPRPVRGELRVLDVHVAPGELVGLVVPDPAEATELLSWLAGDATTEPGGIRIDGVPMDTLTPQETRAAVLVAPHAAHLFGGTVAENVTANGAGETSLAAAMTAAAADEVAASLPAGADTELTDLGRSLSGGQQQRVALARALAADPPVLVLHDPTTAVDSVTEARIADGLRTLRAGRSSTLLVTTSPSLLSVADRVALLEAGRIVAHGEHRDLLREHPGYRTVVIG